MKVESCKQAQAKEGERALLSKRPWTGALKEGQPLIANQDSHHRTVFLFKIGAWGRAALPMDSRLFIPCLEEGLKVFT